MTTKEANKKTDQKDSFIPVILKSNVVAKGSQKE